MRLGEIWDLLGAVKASYLTAQTAYGHDHCSQTSRAWSDSYRSGRTGRNYHTSTHHTAGALQHMSEQLGIAHETIDTLRVEPRGRGVAVGAHKLQQAARQVSLDAVRLTAGARHAAAAGSVLRHQLPQHAEDAWFSTMRGCPRSLCLVWPSWSSPSWRCPWSRATALCVVPL